MTYMDKQNRIAITQNIREICNVDFEKEVRLFLYERKGIKHLLLSNDKNLSLPCFGVVNFDAKFRFFLPKELRRYLNISSDCKFLVFSLNSHLLLKMLD